MALGRAPFAGKRPLLSPVDGFHPSPLVPRQHLGERDRATCAALGCPGGPLAALPHQMLTWVEGRGQGAGDRGGRGGGTYLPCPALPCRPEPTAQHGTGTGTLYLFASPLALPPRSNMEPIDPSHPPARHVKHHAVYINPEGPQPILSQLTPLSPSCSPYIPVISTASLRSIFTASTSPTRAPRPLNTVSHFARPPPALAHPDRRTLLRPDHYHSGIYWKCTTTQHARRVSRNLVQEFEEQGTEPKQPDTRLANRHIGTVTSLTRSRPRSAATTGKKDDKSV